MLICNQFSGKGISDKLLDVFQSKLRDNGYNPKLVLTRRPKHASEIIEKSNQFDLVFSIGGDGTLSRNMIDDNLWYFGSSDSVGENLYDGRININNMYRWERSNVTGRECSSEYATCTDTVVRTTRWVGKVGLIYPSDWAYATGGGLLGRDTCLSYTIGFVDVTGAKNWSNTYKTCFQDDWLSVINSSFFWTINPRSSSTVSRTSFAIDNGKAIRGFSNLNSAIIRPVVYLKSNVTIASGDGSSGSPFVLSY